MKVEIDLPEHFVNICRADGHEPEKVLRAFIADLCGSLPAPYSSNGSDERARAWDYYERVGFGTRDGSPL